MDQFERGFENNFVKTEKRINIGEIKQKLNSLKKSIKDFDQEEIYKKELENEIDNKKSFTSLQKKIKKKKDNLKVNQNISFGNNIFNQQKINPKDLKYFKDDLTLLSKKELINLIRRMFSQIENLNNKYSEYIFKYKDVIIKLKSELKNKIKNEIESKKEFEEILNKNSKSKILDGKNKKISNYKKKLKKSEKIIEELKETNMDISTEIRNDQNIIKNLKEKNIENKRKIKNIKKSFIELREELQDQKNINEELLHKNKLKDGMDDEKQYLEKQLMINKEKIKEIRLRTKILEDKIEILTKNKFKQEEIIFDLNQKIKEGENQIQENGLFKQQLEKIKYDLQKSNKKKFELQQHNNYLKNKINCKEVNFKEKNDIENNIFILKEKICDLEKKNGDLKNEIENRDLLNKELLKKDKDKEMVILFKNDRIEILNEEISQYKIDVKTEKGNQMEKIDFIKNLEKDLEIFKEEIKNLKLDLEIKDEKFLIEKEEIIKNFEDKLKKYDIFKKKEEEKVKKLNKINAISGLIKSFRTKKMELNINK